VAASDPTASAAPVVTALCVDGASYDRFGRVIRHLAVGLVDQAIHVRVVSTDPRVSSLEIGPIQATTRPLVRWPWRKRRLQALVESFSPQAPSLIHALAYESYEVAFALSEALDADLVLQVTSLSDCYELMEFDAPAVRRFLVSSAALGEELQKRCGVVGDFITIVRPGLLVEEHPACFAKPERAVTVVCTSPFERDFGVDLLIEAIYLLRQRGVSLVAFLMGRGSTESALRRMVRARNLSACVVFARPLGDHIPALQNADIMVRPSADTAFSIDTLQALSAGLVVVTFPSTVCDYIRDGETAVVCQTPTAEAIADAMEHLVQDRDRARRIAVSAMDYVQSNHSISAMAERTAEAYRELVLQRSTFAMNK